MKKIFLTIIVTFVFISCKSQTVPLNTYYHDVSSGAYFKDMLGELNKFEGTWQYTNSTDTLTIIIQKRTHVFDGEYYEDLLVGEYRFISSGVELVNTLPFLFDFTTIGGQHKINGRNFISNSENPICNSCTSDEKRIKLYFHDPERNYLSLSLVLRYLPQLPGEPEKMTATLISNHGGMMPNESSPTVPRVPLGEYLMIKE